MTDGAEATTGSGNVRYDVTGTMTLGAISTTGDVQIIASSLTDSGMAGNTDADVTANELAITTTDMATGAIGASTTRSRRRWTVCRQRPATSVCS